MRILYINNITRSAGRQSVARRPFVEAWVTNHGTLHGNQGGFLGSDEEAPGESAFDVIERRTSLGNRQFCRGGWRGSVHHDAVGGGAGWRVHSAPKFLAEAELRDGAFDIEVNPGDHDRFPAWTVRLGDH